jgi:hypothetical protein
LCYPLALLTRLCVTRIFLTPLFSTYLFAGPGSFLEAVKILRPLTHPDDPRQPAFHVVAPSLPNFGFSEGVKRKGFMQAQYAEVRALY